MTGIYNSQNYTEFDLEPTTTPIHLQLLAGNAGTARAMFDDIKVYETSTLSINETNKEVINLILTESQNELIIRNLKVPLEFQLYNASGSLIKKGTMNNSLDISNLQKGVYIFTTTDKTNRSFSKKFLKTK